MTHCFVGGTFLSDLVWSLLPGFLLEVTGIVTNSLSISRYRMFTRRLTPYVGALTRLRSLVSAGSLWICQESVDNSRGGR